MHGAPFFPFGFYGGNKDMMRIGKSPFNTLMLYGASGRERLDEARRNGLMIIAGVNHFPLDAGGDAALAAYMASIRDHPALLAWYVFDEAGVLDIKKWNRRKELVERLDADHPTWGVLNRPDLSGHYLEIRGVCPHETRYAGSVPMRYAGSVPMKQLILVLRLSGCYFLQNFYNFFTNLLQFRSRYFPVCLLL